MKPEKALELVGKYARLTKGIADARKRIGENLDKCKGHSGKRGVEFDTFPTFKQPELDAKGRETDLHLHTWYTPERGDYEYSGYEWLEIGCEEQEECPHCYAAHLAIQERKEMRLALGHVKRAMTRSTR